jgi:hypothetical protein
MNLGSTLTSRISLTTFDGFLSRGKWDIHDQSSPHEFHAVGSFHSSVDVIIFHRNECKPSRVAISVHWDKNINDLAVLAKVVAKLLLGACERHVSYVQLLGAISYKKRVQEKRGESFVRS